MNRIAGFEKVSFEQFEKDWLNTYRDKDFTRDKILDIYNGIKLPRRATKQSAGYDFFLPTDLFLESNRAINIPTGIKCWIDDGWVLNMYPRSGHGFKYGIHLANTVGVIDGDYYGNIGNEGHIFVKLVNDSILANEMTLQEGTAFCQGVFVPFGITTDDEVSAVRTGGFGSTSEQIIPPCKKSVG